jgi:hypothetical protein
MSIVGEHVKARACRGKEDTSWGWAEAKPEDRFPMWLQIDRNGLRRPGEEIFDFRKRLFSPFLLQREERIVPLYAPGNEITDG